MFRQPWLYAECRQCQTVERTTFFFYYLGFSQIQFDIHSWNNTLATNPLAFSFSFVLTFIGLDIVADGLVDLHSCGCGSSNVLMCRRLPVITFLQAVFLALDLSIAVTSTGALGWAEPQHGPSIFSVLCEDKSHSVSSSLPPFHCDRHVLHTLNTA